MSQLVSLDCSLCGRSSETIDHLFFNVGGLRCCGHRQWVGGVSVFVAIFQSKDGWKAGLVCARQR